MVFRRVRCALAATAVLAGAGVWAQQPQAQQPPAQQPPPPIFRAGVRLVRVDVSVTGKGDQPVDNLQASDFEVAEDGVPQKVEQLQFIRLDGHRPPGDDTSLEIRSPEQAEAEAARDDVRLFVIFLDDYHIDKTPAINLPLKRALTTFVDRLWPSDLVAMADPLTSISDLHFTRSRSDLLDVIHGFEGRQGEVFPVKNAFEEEQLRRGDVTRIRAQVTLSALEAVAIKLGSLREGRKTLFFVSQGIPVMLGGAWGELQGQIREVIEEANRANVAISCIDPRGLSAAGYGSLDAMYQLAAGTGGQVVTNTNNIQPGMTKLLGDISAYYVLGYTPTRSEDDGKYHKIDVKVKRSGVHVAARKGYWAPAARDVEAAREAAAAAIPEPGVARALETLAANEQPHPVDVWVGYSRGESGRTLVTISSEDAPNPRRATAARLAVSVRPAVGAPNRGEEGQTLTLTPSQAQPPAAANVLTLAPGPARLRFTARSPDDVVVDEWVLDVVVPDFSGPVALSTPRFAVARTVPEWRAIQAAADPPPRASLRFRRTDRVLVTADCYTGQPGVAPQIEAHLLSKDGHALAPLQVPSPEEGRLRFELPVGSLAQGTYLVRLRARTGQDQAEQVTAIVIVP